MLRELDGCLKCTYFLFDYFEKQKFITKYKQILPIIFTLLYNQITKYTHSTFETGLLLLRPLFDSNFTNQLVSM
jgi:hypothetical protein